MGKTNAANKANFKVAQEAIEVLRGDTSVSWKTTLEQLEELMEMCEGTIEALREEHRGVRTTADVKCEVCGEPAKKAEDRFCCEKCGRAFGPCCNSMQDTICIDCA